MPEGIEIENFISTQKPPLVLKRKEEKFTKEFDKNTHSYVQYSFKPVPNNILPILRKRFNLDPSEQRRLGIPSSHNYYSSFTKTDSRGTRHVLAENTSCKLIE